MSSTSSIADGLNGRMMSLARIDVDDVFEVDDAQRRGRRPRFDANFRLMDRGERAFGSDDELREVEFSVSNELVEVVAADAAHDLREIGVRFRPDWRDDICDSSFEPAAYAAASSNFISRRVRPSPEARTTSISRT